MKRNRYKLLSILWIIFTVCNSIETSLNSCIKNIDAIHSKKCSCKDLILKCRDIEASSIYHLQFNKSLKSISLKAIVGLWKLGNTFLTTLPNVEVLNITRCREVVTVDSDFLQYFPNLRTLKIGINCLREFPHFTRKHRSLQKLILNRNLISSIDARSLSFLPNLYHMELNQNKLEEIRSEWIPTNSSLRVLSLRGNQLYGLPLSLNNSLSNLETLILSRNRFSGVLNSLAPHNSTGSTADAGIIPPNGPDGPGGLKSFDFADQSFQRHTRSLDSSFGSASALRGSRCPALSSSSRTDPRWGRLPILPKLVYLDLSRNCLTGLAPVLMMYFGRLAHLRLSRNRLVRLGTGAFYNKMMGDSLAAKTTGLQFLDLSWNPGLTNVSTEWTFGLKHLRELRLSNCGFQTIKNNAFSSLQLLTHIDLSHNRLTTLEGKTFTKLASLRVLNLDHNQIAEVRSPMFTGLNKLRNLSMSYNKLTTVQVEDPGNLMKSSLQQTINSPLVARQGRQSSNPLKEAEDNIPKKGRNPISSINNYPGLRTTNGLFSDLRHLIRLNLSNNLLTSLKVEDTSGLSRLINLDLSGNPLSQLKTRALCNLPHIESLALDSEHISCDCQLAETTVCLQSRNLQVSGKCSHPSNLKGRSLPSLTPHELESAGNCGPLDTTVRLLTNANPSKEPLDDNENDPSAQAAGNSDWVLLDGNLTLECHVTLPSSNGVGQGWTTVAPPVVRWERSIMVTGGMADGAPVDGTSEGVEAVWRTEEIVATSGGRVDLLVPMMRLYSNLESSKEADPSPSLFSTQSTPQPVTRWYSLLQISPVSLSDEARYRCVVKTTDIAEKVAMSEIKVFSPPQFRWTPGPTISVQEADTVEITCGAVGRPPPTTSLRKVGGSDFPAAKTRRLNVYKDDTHFYISKVRRVDAGLYVCQSSNQAGMIAYNFTLHVNTPAKFTSVPQSRQRVHTGSPLVLTCVVSGYPTPRLYWLRNGRPLNSSSRVHFTDADMLVLNRIEPGDAAVYTASVVNALGSEIFNVTVDVVDGKGRLFLGSHELEEKKKAAETTSRDYPSPAWLSNHLIGIVIIAVVLCVVLTSLLWVLALYCLSWRKQRNHLRLYTAGQNHHQHHRPLPISHTANSLLSSASPYTPSTYHQLHLLKSHQSVPSLASHTTPLLMGRSIDQLEMSSRRQQAFEEESGDLPGPPLPPPGKSKSSGNIVGHSSSDYFTGTSGSCESGGSPADDLPLPPPPPPPPHRHRPVDSGGGGPARSNVELGGVYYSRPRHPYLII